MHPYPRLDDLLELRHQARTLGLASTHRVNSTFAGLFASVFRGTGLDFDEVREYRPGDDVRNMEWHVTARTGVPHLKVFREERERSVILCVDNGPHMDFGTRGAFKCSQAARAAALLGWAANNHHDRVGGLLFGGGGGIGGIEYFNPMRGHRALWRLLNGLTRQRGDSVEVREDDVLLRVLQRIDRGSGVGSLVFVIADLDRDVEPLERTLGSLAQRHDVVLLPVDDPADRELPAMGTVVFEDGQGRRCEIDTDDQTGRDAYRDAWERRRTALKRLANRLGLIMIPLRTDEDIHRTLALGLRRRLQSRGHR